MNRLPLYLEEEENGEEWFCSLQRCTCNGDGLLGFSLYVGDVRFGVVGDFGEQVVVLPMIENKKSNEDEEENQRKMIVIFFFVICRVDFDFSSLSTDFFVLDYGSTLTDQFSKVLDEV